jgi:hypothetical protein
MILATKSWLKLTRVAALSFTYPQGCFLVTVGGILLLSMLRELTAVLRLARRAKLKRMYLSSCYMEVENCVYT